MFPLSFRYVKPRGVIYVTMADHQGMTKKLQPALRAAGAPFEVWSWDRLFRNRWPPRAAYIFTDFERMAAAELEAAGRVRRRLMSYDLPVLNDPVKFLRRDHLINRLKAEGLNSFGCTYPAQGQGPGRYPAFLRTIAGHRGVESDLVHTEAEAQEALDAALASGLPITDLIWVDYVDTRAERDIFIKRSAFSLNGTILRGNSVRELFWTVKSGNKVLATDAEHQEELAELDAYPRQAAMAEVARIAGLEFGRIDYALVGGRVEVFETNTNPTLNLSLGHPNLHRAEYMRRIRHKMTEFLLNLGRSVRPGDRPNLRGTFRASGKINRRPRRR